MFNLFLFCIMQICFGVTDTGFDDPAITKQLESLDEITRTVVQTGRADVVSDLQDILKKLDHPSESLDALRAFCDGRLARGGVRDIPLKRTANQILSIAKSLAGQLDSLDDESRARLAFQIIRLDSDQKQAHCALGHTCIRRTWVAPEMKNAKKRRGEISDALQKARGMTFKIEVSDSEIDFLKELIGSPGSKVRFANMEIHSTLGKKRLRSIMEDFLRAVAMSRFLRYDKLSLPDPGSVRPTKYILVDTKDRYERTLDYCLETGLLSSSDVVGSGTTSAIRSGDFCLDYDWYDEQFKASLLCFAANEWILSQYDSGVWNCLYAGHINWLCLKFFNITVPAFELYDITDPDAYGYTDDYGRNMIVYEDGEQNALFQTAKSSLLGCRMCMRRLVKEGKDPSLEECLPVEEFGQIGGAAILKCTLIADYLHERGDFNRILSKRNGSGDDGRAASLASCSAYLFESTTGESIDELETKWRRWLQAPKQGVAQRLKDVGALTALQSKGNVLLDRLNGIRRLCWERQNLAPPLPVQFDPTLSRGALLHAKYLDQHPNQRKQWPSMHEEYADEQGFTPEGCRAGRASVILDGCFVRKPDEAVDCLMATVYQRLSLLRPGLLRVGWGATRRNGVLDVRTLVQPYERSYSITWPYKGMNDVPLRFEPEQPSPVPDEAQSHWGYPVTLQQCSLDEPSRFELALYYGCGENEKNRVDCYFSSPANPLNPDVVTKNAYYLIPKSPLKPCSTYTVVATNIADDTGFRWNFRTGRS